MSPANFDIEQSILDTLQNEYVKTEQNEDQLNTNIHNNLFGMSEFTSPPGNGVSDLPLFFPQSGSVGVNDSTNFMVLPPSLENEETPGSCESVSLSPQSPLSSLSNTFNPNFALGNSSLSNNNIINETHNEDISSIGNLTSEKRKASVAAVADLKKPTKAAKSGTGKKPGRKADNSEPANKKKAQNRAAQRAFRERKEKHLKELEDRVSELEAESQSTSTENDFLRQQVNRLQNELKKYRSSRNSHSSGPISASSNSTSPNQQFTFEFPFFQRSQNVSSVSNTKSSSQSNNSSPSSLLSPGSVLGSISSVSSLHSPEQVNAKSCASSQDPGEESFCENLNLACGTRENPIPRALVPTNGESPLIICANEGANNSSVNNSKPSNQLDVISPPIFELDFLSEYRDPIFDNEDFSLPDLTTESSMFDPLDPLASISDPSFAKQPLPAAPISQPEEEGEEEEETVPASSTKLMTCTAVWDRISAHPKFSELDIDGLCAELRTKAKCSETGVVLSEKDVNNVLSTLNAA